MNRQFRVSSGIGQLRLKVGGRFVQGIRDRGKLLARADSIRWSIRNENILYRVSHFLTRR
jgi:hypothetical protein